MVTNASKRKERRQTEGRQQKMCSMITTKTNNTNKIKLNIKQNNTSFQNITWIYFFPFSHVFVKTISSSFFFFSLVIFSVWETEIPGSYDDFLSETDMWNKEENMRYPLKIEISTYLTSAVKAFCDKSELISSRFYLNMSYRHLYC